MSYRVCEQGQQVRQDIYTLIQANQAKLPVRSLCKNLNVSVSGYYDWCQRAPSKRSVANRVLTERIKQVHEDSDFTYGRPRIHSELRDMGLLVNHKRVGRLMCLAGIRGVSRRRGFVVTTRRDKEQKAAPDLVNRQFVATGINQRPLQK